MGLLSIFSKYSKAENEMIKDHINGLSDFFGLNKLQAKREIKRWLEKIQKRMIDEGTSNLPKNYGNLLLKMEATDPRIKSLLAIKRKEGVTDNDIIAWWNMTEVERQLLRSMDEFAIEKFRKESLEKGLSIDKVEEYIKKYYVLYGEPMLNDTINSDDKPLPFELKLRINDYLDPLMKAETDNTLWNEILAYSSANAYIRTRIQLGEI